MGLDIRTIIVMLAMLTLMLAALLELARLHAGSVQGIRQWALANLCSGIGLGLAYFYSTPTGGHQWAIVLGSTLLATGIGLQFNGIQRYKGLPGDIRIAALIVSIVFIENIWLTIVQPDISTRAVANSLLYAIGYATCAHALLIRIEAPLRTAYWFTGLSFAVLSAVLLARSVVIGLSEPGVYAGIYTQVPINSLLFLIASMVQLFVTFGFVLMLNYRLVTDMHKLATRDALTGAFNRRRLEEEAGIQQARHVRTGETLALMLIDIDHFKSINDHYGHQAGDQILQRLVDIAQKATRADDYFARFGGDEFCFLLPATTEQEAFVLADRLRGIYAAEVLQFMGNSLKSTITIGVADSTHTGLAFTSLLAAADLALYSAKQLGRNQVATHSSTLQIVDPVDTLHSALPII